MTRRPYMYNYFHNSGNLIFKVYSCIHWKKVMEKLVENEYHEESVNLELKKVCGHREKLQLTHWLCLLDVYKEPTLLCVCYTLMFELTLFTWQMAQVKLQPLLGLVRIIAYFVVIFSRKYVYVSIVWCM